MAMNRGRQRWQLPISRTDQGLDGQSTHLFDGVPIDLQDLAEFARVLNHEAIHVAQSCKRGSITA